MTQGDVLNFFEKNKGWFRRVAVQNRVNCGKSSTTRSIRKLIEDKLIIMEMKPIKIKTRYGFHYVNSEHYKLNESI